MATKIGRRAVLSVSSYGLSTLGPLGFLLAVVDSCKKKLRNVNAPFCHYHLQHKTFLSLMMIDRKNDIYNLSCSSPMISENCKFLCQLLLGEI